MEKLGIAIIGAGAIADVHVRAYLEYPERCEIRMICNRSPEKAVQMIDLYHLPAKACADYHEVLEDDSIDAVSICLPPSMHAAVSIDALNAGKHVICEKPMAGSVEECDEMITAASQNGKLLSIVAQNRWKTPYAKVKQLLDEGAVGKIQYAAVNSLWWRGENYYDIWWRGTWAKETGGCVANHAVHHIDLIQWMFGMPESVYAVISNVGHRNSECEDLAAVVLRYPDKAVQLTTSLVTHCEEQMFRIDGERAEVCVPWNVTAVQALPNGFPEPNKAVEEEIQSRYEAIPALAKEGHPAQILNFLKAIAGEEVLQVDGSQGRNTIELISAIYKSAKSGEAIKLPLEEKDVFYGKGGIASSMTHFHEKTKSVDHLVITKPISLGSDVGK